MSTLIVTLPLSMPETGVEYDYVLTRDGNTITRSGRAPASLLPALPKSGDDVVVVIPAPALSWHQLEIPKGVIDKGLHKRGGQQTRLRAVLEGLLEEQVLDETGQLHFALAPDAQAGQPAWVAACDRTWLRACLQTLEGAQHPVSRIVPELAPDTTDQPATLYVTQALNTVQVLSPNVRGVTVLPLSSATVNLLAWPDTQAIAAEPGVAELAEQLFKRPVSLLPPGQRWLQAAQSRWNLAQFDLVSSGRTRILKKFSLAWATFLRAPQWRAARWAVWLLLASHVLGLNAWAWKERSALEEKRTAIRNTLVQTFPDVRVVLDAPLQMEREVSVLQQATGAISNQDLEAILGTLGAVTPANQGLTAIEFAAGEARLKGLQIKPEETQNFAAQLETRGYRARWEGDQLLIQAEISR
jgi:general secretion pathway protein L